MVAIGKIKRSSPWPFDYRLNGVGLMGGTKTRQSTEYVSYKPDDFGQSAPNDISYNAENPTFGATTSYEQMRRGMGLRVQRSQNASEDEQYDHALGIDFSVYPWVVGPLVGTITPATTDATNGVVKFLKVASTLYAITGRYALVRASDVSWTVAQDFGSGKVATDAIDFYSNAHSAAYGLVAMGDSENFWHVSAGSWTQHATLKARSFGVAARELYRAHTTNTLTKVDLDTDWTVAANWGNEYAFDVGDQSAGITRLPTTADGTLLVLKEDGLYQIQGINDPNPGYDRKFQDYVLDAANGKAVTRWGNETYVGTTYSGVWRYSSDGSTREQCGPELLTDGSNVVTGQVTAMKGTQWALYGSFWNPDTSGSYLCKFLGMVEIEGVRHPVWHGSLTQALGSKVTAMETDGAGAASGHVRLFLGFANGTIGWFTLPNTRHPIDSTGYRFTTTSGVAYLPRWDGGFGANDKALESYTVSSPNFSSTTYATIDYRTNPAGSFTALGSQFDTGEREAVAFPDGLAATTVDTKLTMVNGASTTSTQINGIGLRTHLHTPYKQVFQIRVLADDGLLRRDGTPMRIGRERQDAVVVAAADAAGGVAIVLPDGTAKRVHVRQPRQESSWGYGPRRCRAWTLECVEISTNIHGTYERLEALGSYEALESYTYGGLEAV